MADLDWGAIYTQRKAIAHRFGDIWDVPLERRYHRVLQPLGKKDCRVLEIGAGDRALKKKLENFWGSVSYVSCDIDPNGNHDFSHIDDVEGEFDVVCGFEVIEHVKLTDAYQMVHQCFNLLPVGGVIALTTPNIYYPPAFLRDATHITPFCFDELGGLLQACGFEVTQIYRLYHDSILKKLLKRYVCYLLFRLLGIDFAEQIMVVAVKRDS